MQAAPDQWEGCRAPITSGTTQMLSWPTWRQSFALECSRHIDYQNWAKHNQLIRTGGACSKGQDARSQQEVHEQASPFQLWTAKWTSAAGPQDSRLLLWGHQKLLLPPSLRFLTTLLEFLHQSHACPFGTQLGKPSFEILYHFKDNHFKLE